MKCLCCDHEISSEKENKKNNGYCDECVKKGNNKISTNNYLTDYLSKKIKEAKMKKTLLCILSTIMMVYMGGCSNPSNAETNSISQNTKNVETDIQPKNDIKDFFGVKEKEKEKPTARIFLSRIETDQKLYEFLLQSTEYAREFVRGNHLFDPRTCDKLMSYRIFIGLLMLETRPYAEKNELDKISDILNLVHDSIKATPNLETHNFYESAEEWEKLTGVSAHVFKVFEYGKKLENVACGWPLIILEE